jgi:hypothetical protein
MSPSSVRTLAPVLLALCTATARAQTPPAGPMPHALGPVVATSPVVFGAVSHVVPLSGGRTLVSDATKKVALLLDSSLKVIKVVLDSVGGQRNSYTAQSFLFPFRGDSTFFFEYTAKVLVVIEPDGTLGRIMAPPSTGLSTLNGVPGSSPSLGLLYRASMSRPPLAVPAAGEPDNVRRTQDSMVVLRMDYATRMSDTVAKLSTGGFTIETRRPTGFSTSYRTALYPFYDAAMATTDGSIVIFHAREYRLEFVAPDGKRTMGARLSYPWQRVSDDMRQHLIDSVNGVRKKAFDSLLAKRVADSIRTGQPPMTNMTTVTGDGERITRQIPATAPRPPELVSAEEVPDFLPPTGPSPMLADADNNVWLKPKPLVPDSVDVVWEIVNRQGTLVDRVRVPIDRSIVGFAPGGHVLLTARDGGVVTLQKVRVR